MPVYIKIKREQPGILKLDIKICTVGINKN